MVLHVSLLCIRRRDAAHATVLMPRLRTDPLACRILTARRSKPAFSCVLCSDGNVPRGAPSTARTWRRHRIPHVQGEHLDAVKRHAQLMKRAMVGAIGCGAAAPQCARCRDGKHSAQHKPCAPAACSLLLRRTTTTSRRRCGTLARSLASSARAH